jgi:predicted nucleotidyltransferase
VTDPNETQAQIEAIVEGLHEILGSDLVGAYLHGSAVLGGFRPRSDIDIVAISGRPTTAAEKKRLVDLMLSISGRGASRGPGRPVELDIVVASEIRPWTYPPRFDFHYDELLRGEFEKGNLEPWGGPTNPDLASALTMVLLGNKPLVGPEPSQVLDPVPRRDYLNAILRDLHTIDEYISWDTRNVVLTLTRIWSAVGTDEVLSKEDSAVWALERLPDEHRPVLELALAGYRGETDDRWDDLLEEARAYSQYIASEIEKMNHGH